VSSDKYISNARKPKGSLGKKFIRHMNEHHKELIDWGFEHIKVPRKAEALDVGCGGGYTVRLLRKKYKCKKVYGVDYSKTSVKMAKKATRFLRNVKIKHGNVSSLPFRNKKFDLVTAVETIYYWPDIEKDFLEIYRILKKNGQFLIICEDCIPGNEVMKDMKIYTQNEIHKLLIHTGYKEVQTFRTNNWVCAIAKK